jgi:hypothetical protein
MINGTGLGIKLGSLIVYFEVCNLKEFFDGLKPMRCNGF